jgi:hypothetical protein
MVSAHVKAVLVDEHTAASSRGAPVELVSTASTGGVRSESRIIFGRRIEFFLCVEFCAP